MQDAFGRTVNYLRVSVTDRCNLRCIYCMPKEGISWIPSEEILHYEEIATIVMAMAQLGVNKIRITGGEPLVRADLPRLVKMIRAIPGINDIALSTNGILLASHAEALAHAGLSRINVSLDTLLPHRFNEIARRPGLEKVFQGIERAEKLGLTPIKINVVLIRGKNQDEIIPFARLTLTHPWVVRFIELMPINKALPLPKEAFVSAEEVLSKLKEMGELKPLPSLDASGPARYFRLDKAPGTIGVISPLSQSFCEGCNRVRLTAEGKLKLCLFGDGTIDLKGPLRRGATISELKEMIKEAMSIKPERHSLIEKGASCTSMMAMSQIGG